MFPSRTPRRAVLAALALPALLSAACGGSSAPSQEPASAPAPAPPAPGGQPAAAPPAAPDGGLAPIGSRDRTGGIQVVAAGAAFVFPEDWRQEPPSSSMRLAQASLPGPDGDATLTLFHFGPGGGGGVESNLARWVGQVEVDPANPPVQDRFEASPFTVHWIEAQGTLLPSTMGTGPDAPQPGARLLGAVVEGPGGPWFFKITGPAETVAAHRAAFIDMLKTAQVAS